MTRFKIKAEVIVTSMRDLSKTEKEVLAVKVEEELNTNKFTIPLRFRFKEIIKFQTSIIIKGLPPNSSDSKGYFTNVFFDITPKQAKEMIIELEKVLKRINKRGERKK